MLVRSGFGTFEFNDDFWKLTPSCHRDIFDPNNNVFANGTVSSSVSGEEIKRLLGFMQDHPIKEHIALLSPSAWERLGKPDKINRCEVKVIDLPDGMETVLLEKGPDWVQK